MSREKAMTAHMPAEFRGLESHCRQAGTPLAEQFLSRFAQALNDGGDIESMAITRRSEARDFAILDVLIECIAADALSGKPIDLGGLTQAMNAKSGKARVLGLERRPKRIRGLQQVMRGAE